MAEPFQLGTQLAVVVDLAVVNDDERVDDHGLRPAGRVDHRQPLVRQPVRAVDEEARPVRSAVGDGISHGR
jgi:hypothetical protein